jgi:hypothetical protein
MSDWKEALGLFRATVSALERLRLATERGKIKLNGHKSETSPASLWDEVRSRTIHAYREATIRAFPVNARLTSRPGLTLLRELGLDRTSVTALALAAREADWSRTSYKEHVRTQAGAFRARIADEERLHGLYSREDTLREFLVTSGGRSPDSSSPRLAPGLRPQDEHAGSLLPYVLPSRAYTPEEIALYLPDQCVFGEPMDAAQNWADYTRAVRGVWVRSHLAEENVTDEDGSPESASGGAAGNEPPRAGPNENDDDEPPIVAILGESTSFPIRLGVTSFGTTKRTWEMGASGAPDLSIARYARLAKLVNDVLKAQPSAPTHLLLPELSVPEQWLSTIGGVLANSGISLVTGLDYRVYSDGTINSSAALVLRDDRLGYPSTLQIRQVKQAAAPGEEYDLLRSFGRTWRGNIGESRPVYVHNGFSFGVVVCSELQNVEYRLAYQGIVDLLIVLSWNRDLDTFSALVESATLDIHSYVALVNNREYGDSRVRSPSKQSFSRDLCRLKGGLNDHFVVVPKNPTELRAQQSRDKRWITPDDKYKPAPEGFKIWPKRRVIPS